MKKLIIFFLVFGLPSLNAQSLSELKEELSTVRNYTYEEYVYEQDSQYILSKDQPNGIVSNISFKGSVDGKRRYFVYFTSYFRVDKGRDGDWQEFWVEFDIPFSSFENYRQEKITSLEEEIKKIILQEESKEKIRKENLRKYELRREEYIKEQSQVLDEKFNYYRSEIEDNYRKLDSLNEVIELIFRRDKSMDSMSFYNRDRKLKYLKLSSLTFDEYLIEFVPIKFKESVSRYYKFNSHVSRILRNEYLDDDIIRLIKSDKEVYEKGIPNPKDYYPYSSLIKWKSNQKEKLQKSKDLSYKINDGEGIRFDFKYGDQWDIKKEIKTFNRKSDKSISDVYLKIEEDFSFTFNYELSSQDERNYLFLNYSLDKVLEFFEWSEISLIPKISKSDLAKEYSLNNNIFKKGKINSIIKNLEELNYLGKITTEQKDFFKTFLTSILDLQKNSDFQIELIKKTFSSYIEYSLSNKEYLNFPFESVNQIL